MAVEPVWFGSHRCIWNLKEYEMIEDRGDGEWYARNVEKKFQKVQCIVRLVVHH